MSYIERLRYSSTHCNDADTRGSREIRRPKIECLLELAQQKLALEERIEQCQSELDQAFLSTAKMLQAALTGRIEELSE